MGRGLAVALVALGLFLAVGLLTIVRAAVGESTLPPQQAMPPARRRRAQIATALAVVLLLVVANGGRAWWQSEADAYRGILFVPLELHASVTERGGAPVLDISIADRNWLDQTVSPLVPDHGKLMHAFLVRLPDGDAFAHVHPEATGNLSFRLAPPPLPAGRYVFYGDIVHESGTTQTLTTGIELPAPTECTGEDCIAPDVDDSWTAAPAADGSTFVVDDGLRIEWERPATVVAGRELELRFRATDAAGDPVALEPYMGMAAHAAVRREDGAVFVHLHPTGTISMAAQGKMAERTGLAMPADHSLHTAAPSGEIDLLYAFPQPGRYRLWLQVKAGGKVRTASWEVEVEA